MLCNIQEDFILYSFLNTMTHVVLPLMLKHCWYFPLIMVFSFQVNFELFLVIAITSLSFFACFSILAQEKSGFTWLMSYRETSRILYLMKHSLT